MGTRIVMTLMEDSLTSQNWFLVVTMGRKAGHLALAVGKSSGATLTIIPEEWRSAPVRLQEVVDILAMSVIRRRTEGKMHGVALIAEGILDSMAGEDLAKLDEVQLDEHGHIRMEEINLADLLKRSLNADLKRLGLSVGLRDKELGYELRCVPPLAYDVDYTRSLGLAAVDFLLSDGTDATVTIQENQVAPMPFDGMLNPETGRMRVRVVDVDSFTYRSAHKLMIRLKPEDRNNEELIERMAAQTNLSRDAFIVRYGYLMDAAPRPF
jgi:6-phosphofructokinase 1